MPLSVILELEPSQPFSLPQSHGAIAHAVALDLALRYSASLASHLHDDNGAKPFTVSLLHTDAPRSAPMISLQPGTCLTWRLTGLTPDTEEWLSSLQPGQGLRFGSGIMTLRRLYLPGEHPDARQASYDELISTWTAWPEAALPRSFQLEFSSPTVFRQGATQFPFPAPATLWGSLMQRWLSFAPLPFPPLSAEIREQILLQNWRGETRRLEQGRRKTVGFVGRFEYGVWPGIPWLNRLLAILADWAFYSGTGWQTNAGLGQLHWRNRPPIIAAP